VRVWYFEELFRSIDGKPFWSYETQVNVVLASCIIHNCIMKVDPYDFFYGRNMFGK